MRRTRKTKIKRPVSRYWLCFSPARVAGGYEATLLTLHVARMLLPCSQYSRVGGPPKS